MTRFVAIVILAALVAFGLWVAHERYLMCRAQGYGVPTCIMAGVR